MADPFGGVNPDPGNLMQYFDQQAPRRGTVGPAPDWPELHAPPPAWERNLIRRQLKVQEAARKGLEHLGQQGAMNASLYQLRSAQQGEEPSDLLSAALAAGDLGESAGLVAGAGPGVNVGRYTQWRPSAERPLPPWQTSDLLGPRGEPLSEVGGRAGVAEELFPQARPSPRLSPALRRRLLLHPETRDRLSAAALEADTEVQRWPLLEVANPSARVIKPNSDPGYKWTADCTGSCQRAEGFIKGLQRLKELAGPEYTKDLGDRYYAAARAAKLPTPCPHCYSTNQRVAGAAQQSKYLPGVAQYGEPGEFSSKGGYNNLLDMGPEQVDAFRPGGDVGFLRFFGNTDWKPESHPALLMLARELARQKAAGGAYTRMEPFVRAFPGIYSNMSVGEGPIGGGISGQMSEATARRLREEVPRASISASPTTLEEALDYAQKPWVDHMTMLHLSGSSKKDLAERTGGLIDPSLIADWTKVQHERELRKNDQGLMKWLAASPEKAIGWRDLPNNNVDEYLKLANQRGLKIKFPDLYKRLDDLGPEYRQLFMKALGREFGKFGETGEYQPVTEDLIRPEDIDLRAEARKRSLFREDRHRPYSDVAGQVWRQRNAGYGDVLGWRR